MISCGLLREIVNMARKFGISVHRNDENIHLRLTGDLDGISAHELLDLVKRYCKCSSRVFIHTSCLRNIHPFGRTVFHAHLSLLKGQRAELVFTGEHASQLAPERSVLFDMTISTAPSVPISGIRPFASTSTKVEHRVARQESLKAANRKGCS